MKIQIRRHPGARSTDSTFDLDANGQVTVIDTQASHVVLEETFVGPIFKTADGACLAVFMRDDGFEANCWHQDPAIAIDPEGGLPSGAVMFSVSPGRGLHVFSQGTPIVQSGFGPFPREEQKEAMLGYATNRELLTELECRCSMGSTHPDYSTMTSDLFPTLCALAGIKPPASVQGRDFTMLLDKPDAAFREAAYSRFIKADAVITDRFSYTSYGKGKGEMLYDPRLMITSGPGFKPIPVQVAH